MTFVKMMTAIMLKVKGMYLYILKCSTTQKKAIAERFSWNFLSMHLMISLSTFVFLGANNGS